MKYYKIDGYYKRDHPLWWNYQGMLARCYNPNNAYYEYYGGRGIKVVQRWRGEKGFDFFVKDMGMKPDGYTLNRINNNRGYSPKNCEWASHRNQALNRRNSRNTSSYPGVSWHKRNNQWAVFIDLPRGPDGKKNRKHLGYFHDLPTAIKTRKEAENARLLEEQERLRRINAK